LFLGTEPGGRPARAALADLSIRSGSSSQCRLAFRFQEVSDEQSIHGRNNLALSLLGAGAATAADLYPWNDHAAPFTFVFGNDIDTHQQTRKTRTGTLFGFFYIQFTGVVTKDRYRVATHVDCNASPDCTVGWTLKGTPVGATFLYQVEHDHPVFLVNRADIPQPGAHAHFHWLGGMPNPGEAASGYLLQLTAVDAFCFIHHGAEGATGNKTCRENGGIKVNPGIDIATHLNIVTSFPAGM
jgi:hypothetical protein